jgi:hypothetical protein
MRAYLLGVAVVVVVPVDPVLFLGVFFLRVFFLVVVSVLLVVWLPEAGGVAGVCAANITGMATAKAIPKMVFFMISFLPAGSARYNSMMRQQGRKLDSPGRLISPPNWQVSSLSFR